MEERKEGVKSLLSIEREAIKGIIEAYESELAEVEKSLVKHREIVGTLEKKKQELVEGLKIPKKHLAEIEAAESKSPSQQTIATAGSTGGPAKPSMPESAGGPAKPNKPESST